MCMLLVKAGVIVYQSVLEFWFPQPINGSVGELVAASVPLTAKKNGPAPSITCGVSQKSGKVPGGKAVVTGPHVKVGLCDALVAVSAGKGSMACSGRQSLTVMFIAAMFESPPSGGSPPSFTLNWKLSVPTKLLAGV